MGEGTYVPPLGDFWWAWRLAPWPRRAFDNPCFWCLMRKFNDKLRKGVSEILLAPFWQIPWYAPGADPWINPALEMSLQDSEL